MSVQFFPPEGEPESGAAGPSTASAGSVMDPHWAELSDLVSRVRANRVESSRLQAERAEFCAEAIVLVADRVLQRAAARGARAADLSDDIPLREVLAELSAALRVGEQTVRTWLGDGEALVHRFSRTLEALREGRIDERHASAIIDGGAGLRDDLRDEYEMRVLEVAAEATAPALREAARVIAARLQPDLVDARQKAAHERRRVRVFSVEDGLARLSADGPAALVFAMYDRLTEMAGSLDGDPNPTPAGNDGADADSDSYSDADSASDAAGPSVPMAATEDRDGPGEPGGRDERCMDERRFDVLADLLLTGAPTGHGDGDALGAIRGTVHVTVPVLTLAGLDDEPALLAGHGPIDADTARRIAAGATGWDRILTHPHSGAVLAVDRYAPTANMRRHLAARDRHCRWPGCRRAARRCDADHTVAWADGGSTCDGNLAMFCRRHHTLKHASPWRVRQCGAGALEFVSPTGRTYRNNAPPILEHVPPPWLRVLPPHDPHDPAPF